MELVHALSTVLSYAVVAFCVVIVFLVVLGGIIMIIESVKEHRRKPFSLNPEWDATRDFIDAIPTKKGRNK